LGPLFRKFFHDIHSKETTSKNNNGDKCGSERPLQSNPRSNNSTVDDGRKGYVLQIKTASSSIVRSLSFGKNKKKSSALIKPLNSFAEAHEYGLDTFSPVVEGYDDKPITRLDPPSQTNLAQ
jgi:hypothetical protein